ncbi:MAG: biopolymer transporter ExbD [Spirochaetales bacterium]|nr:biopolymer transporter ExbD [Spirochaetales bacterium]
MRLRKRRAQIRSNVDMTPMLDVVFQLIIFFLVSTTFAILPGIKLNLPQSRTAEGTSVQGITITAQSNGNFYFNDKQVSLAALSVELSNFDTGDIKKDEFPVSLEADSEVTNGTVVSIFDVIRENGFSMINLRTTSEKK